MKAVDFSLARPRDLKEAAALLADTRGERRKIIAGGQSLGPMLNLRLVEPDVVIDISAIPELKRCEREGAVQVIGACVTHADIEDGRVSDIGSDVLRRVAGGIAYRAVRNRGTIGGSLAHADPAADWVTALSVLGAEIEIASTRGTRSVRMADFITGALSTALDADELLSAVRIPLPPPSAGFGYVKHARKIGEFAHALGAALIDRNTGTGRAVIGAIDAAPIIFEDVRVLFGGRDAVDVAHHFNRDVVADHLARAGVMDPVDQHIHTEILRRALLQASGAPLRVAA
ncbi:caffeine dehydrogenase subunit beta [Variibacter gotjawalensis]|uniref:Caffeine dehydrogenase subunit beta n=1 Tax=Variibacter gotjawalensis TaxID=1333996 RepID=A0A0S3PZS6_9BRAD|nr:FAD binding domain-containing protein [Variibacter gotjawalensis]NIK47277.1 carbon-monoxide dehydrogenase medium subunit [Variibacter gotjawalensis]RZS49177.1 carbon-monoxide dehydrogenase medium subunit [Variibacter gotjawalensis]BAT61439.1 caffeine dehydrogenase subunit beta [Variibacter gotjawalensis]